MGHRSGWWAGSLTGCKWVGSQTGWCSRLDEWSHILVAFLCALTGECVGEQVMVGLLRVLRADHVLIRTWLTSGCEKVTKSLFML